LAGERGACRDFTPRYPVGWAGFPSGKFGLAEPKRWDDGWWLVGNLGFLSEDWPTKHNSVPKDLDLR